MKKLLTILSVFLEEAIMINLDFLQAHSGDSFLLSFQTETKRYNILIDSGIKNTYNHSLAERINAIPENENIDLLIITHIDIDHIGGILRYIEKESLEKIKSKIKEIWFNSGITISKHFLANEFQQREIKINIQLETLEEEIDTNFKHGITLERFLQQNLNDIWIQELIHDKTIKEFDKYKLIVISPNLETLKELNENWQTELDEISTDTANKKSDWELDIESLAKNKFSNDPSLANKSSIGFLFQLEENKEIKNKILFLADAHNAIIRDSLIGLGFSKQNKLVVDTVKLSHHGSKCNLDFDLLEIIESNRFLISTSGKIGFPDKEALSKILCNPERMKDNQGKYIQAIEFIFNYPEENFQGLFNKDEKFRYNFKCSFNEKSEKWVTISL